MAAPQEIVLSTIDGQTPKDRLQVVHCHGPQGSRVELRQQSWAEGIGWFTQTTLPLAPEQVGQLRATLGSGGTAARPKQTARNIQSTRGLRIARADSA